MKIGPIARKLLPPITIDAARWLRNTATNLSMQTKLDKDLVRYVQNGAAPWSPGYEVHREKFIRGTLADQALLARFRQGEALPAQYDIGIDERCVEYPWLMVNLAEGPEVLLDAGSTFNHTMVLDQPVLRDKVIHILTLAPEKYCYWQRGISYLFHDLRDIPIRDDYYDTVVCLSTLEHVGCDNTLFINNDRYQEHRPEDFVVAVQELRRVLKPGGSLFLTVPFGAYQYHELFQQFDRKLLSRAEEAFGPAAISERFYRYSAGGWQIANADECAECEYVKTAPWLRSTTSDLLYSETDLAVAARCVACVQMIKR